MFLLLRNKLVFGFGFIPPKAGQRDKERNPDSYRDAAASQRTLREILKPGHYHK
jgi:hypothetical protein